MNACGMKLPVLLLNKFSILIFEACLLLELDLDMYILQLRPAKSYRVGELPIKF